MNSGQCAQSQLSTNSFALYIVAIATATAAINAVNANPLSSRTPDAVTVGDAVGAAETVGDDVVGIAVGEEVVGDAVGDEVADSTAIGAN